MNTLYVDPCEMNISIALQDSFTVYQREDLEIYFSSVEYYLE